MKRAFQLIRIASGTDVIRSAQPLSAGVATIGNFDGMHLGHQHIVTKVVAKAQAQQLVPTVITFEPSPQVVLRSGQPHLRLMTFSQKITILKSLGIQRMICLRFNATLAKLLPLAFVQHYLVQYFQIAELVIGTDFRFGHQAQGDINLLQDAAAALGFRCEIVDVDHKKISSSGIRQALIQGDLPLAKAMLGRDYTITKRVIHGDARGRQLGFPTANLPISPSTQVFAGVYVVNVEVHGATQGEKSHYQGVANLGIRPTLLGSKPLLEAHLFDFSGNLYGKRITVTFLHKLRDEMRFGSLMQLKQQIEKDSAQAKNYFKQQIPLCNTL